MMFVFQTSNTTVFVILVVVITYLINERIIISSCSYRLNLIITTILDPGERPYIFCFDIECSTRTNQLLAEITEVCKQCSSPSQMEED